MTSKPTHSEKISPTAYATGHMWVRLGLSHPALSTARGKRLDRAFSLAIQPGRLFGRPGLFDTLMLARHRGIDTLLEDAIQDGRITQVIELAAGLSGRGLRMVQKYGDRIHYLETDLPHMANLKREMLHSAGQLSPQHQVLAVDALNDSGPESLSSVANMLDHSQGLAIITEGLLSYLDPAIATDLWQRIAALLKAFPEGLYLSDGYIKSENSGVSARFVRTLLQRFVKGRLHVHYSSPQQAESLMQSTGFTSVHLHAPVDLPATRELGHLPGGNRVRVLEAWVG